MKDFSFSKKIIFFSAVILLSSVIMLAAKAEVSTTLAISSLAGTPCTDGIHRPVVYFKSVCVGNKPTKSLSCRVDIEKCDRIGEQGTAAYNQCAKILDPYGDEFVCGAACHNKAYACYGKCLKNNVNVYKTFACNDACDVVEKTCIQGCKDKTASFKACVESNVSPLRIQREQCLKEEFWLPASAEQKAEAVICRAGLVCVPDPKYGAVCNNLPKAPISPPGSKTPSIVAITPTEVMAGEAYKDDNFAKHGFVVYETAYIPFKIYGKNLQGANLSNDSIGLDGLPGIDFAVTEVINNGAEVHGYIYSRPTAKEGVINITLTNKDGLTAQTLIQVKISGTQYLKRQFKDTVILKGDWPDPMPSQRVLDLEIAINDGLNEFKKVGYPKLQILPAVFEKTFWNDSICGPDEPGSFVGGCANEASRIIDIREIANLPAIKSTMLHEAAHKLDFYHRGEYRGVPGSPTNADTFFKEWYTAASVVNARTCPLYLPLRNVVTWKDGTSRSAHCGMIEAYGASDPVDDSITLGNSWETHPGLYEDVATMVQNFVFKPGAFSVPDASTDPRYPKKVQLLKNYEFVP